MFLGGVSLKHFLFEMFYVMSKETHFYLFNKQRRSTAEATDAWQRRNPQKHIRTGLDKLRPSSLLWPAYVSVSGPGVGTVREAVDPVVAEVRPQEAEPPGPGGVPGQLHQAVAVPHVHVGGQLTASHQQPGGARREGVSQGLSVTSGLSTEFQYAGHVAAALLGVRFLFFFPFFKICSLRDARRGATTARE